MYIFQQDENVSKTTLTEKILQQVNSGGNIELCLFTIG